MTECPTCRKSTQGIITDPENLEICSVCGTILAESSITTEISLYIGSQPYKPKSELKSSDVAYLSSILHFYNMSGYLEEAKAIISKLRQTIYARVPKYSYGAIACILARKYSKPISLHQISAFLNYSPSLVIKAYQQCLKISGIVLPTADPEIYFHQFFELFTGKSIITDSDRSFFLRRFSSLHQLYHSAYYFEGRLPQAAFFATFLTCLSPIIPLTNVKIIEFSKIVELSGITVRQRVKDIEKILSQFLLPKLLNMSTLENNLEVFFKYASIFQIGDIEGQPESMKRNQAISKARLDAANQIDTMLNAQCEENRSFLENLYYSDPPLKNMLFLASLGVPTKMLLEMTDLALSELVEISQLHGEYDMQ